MQKGKDVRTKNGVTGKTAEGLLEQISTLKLFETDNAPEVYSDVREVVVTSPRNFTVDLDGVKKRARSLKIRHPTPLTVYGIEGMRGVSYRAPADSNFPSADAVEIRLNPKGGALAVTSYGTVPEEKVLATRQLTGKTVKVDVYRDPRVVEVDGRNFPNVKTVQVRGLREAEIILYK